MIPVSDHSELLHVSDRPIRHTFYCRYWKSPKIAGSTSNVPKATAGALDAALIGAWQHTHIDTGAGFKPVGAGTDIRLPAPASGERLYGPFLG